MQKESPTSVCASGAISDLNRSADDLFPQKFTPFEYYFWIEDRPNYPSVFLIRLECHGPINRAAFERAFEMAHARHPFLSARIEAKGNSWPRWIAGQAAGIRWTDSPAASDTEFMVSSPERLQAHVNRDGDNVQLTFVFDHVAVDGMGGFQFVTDLMVAYAHECAGVAGTPPWRALNRELLRDRAAHGLFHRRIRFVDLLRIGQVGVPLMLRRAAAFPPLQQLANGETHRRSGGDFLVHTMTERETAELVRVARQRSVRLHNLLLRDYFLMLADWNRGTCERKRPIRVLVPTNLRRKVDYRMSAANAFGYVFVTRRPGECHERAPLLESLSEEMSKIRRHKWGLYYEANLRLFCIWPRLLRWSLNRKWPFATAVFTNLNAGFDHIPLPWQDGRRVAGDLVVENGYGAGPINAETRLSLAIHSYAGRMSLCVRADKQRFGADEQRAILDAYLDQLRKTVQSQS
jgi:NRPS condensation-like uncharacterized protein